MSNEHYLNNKSLEEAIAKFQRSKRDKAKYEVVLLQMKKFPGKLAKKASAGMTAEEVLRAYDQANIEYGESQATLTTAFYTLSQNLIHYGKQKWGPSAFNLTDEEDSIQESVVVCFDKIDKFDPNFVGENGKKSNAFNYLTTCILNHFRQLYRTARNYSELKKRYHDHLQAQMEQQPIRKTKERTKASNNPRED